MKKHYEKFRIWLGRYKYADKAAHAIVGFIIALIASLVFSDPWLCFGMAFIAGIAKESYDHNCTKLIGSWLDFLATAFGGLIYVAICFV